MHTFKPTRLYRLCVFLAMIVFLFPGAQALAQKKVYFDNNWAAVEKKSLATYYRTEEKRKDGKYQVKDFYMADKKLLTDAECKSVEPGLVYDGKVTRYYGNGQIEWEGVYKDHVPAGVFSFYNEDGTPLREQLCRGNERRYVQYWYDHGKTAIVNGRGTVVEHFKEKDYTQYIEFRDSLIACAFDIRHGKADTIYYYSTDLEGEVSYPGGLDNLYKVMYRELKYPRMARANRIEGQVMVGFIVNRQGALEEVEIASGLGHGCDEVVLACISKYTTGWIPAIYKGKPVKTRMKLPFQFKLTE